MDGTAVMNVRLEGRFSLRAPLSHIGESISTTSYLVQEPLLQPDGSLEEVFSYSGNAWRGQLRDLAATYMLERLGSPQLPADAFHLLFSGGRIGGEQVIDLVRARAYRRAVPLIAVWGGGVGNQILPGKLRVSNAYPICREALRALPAEVRAEAESVSYRGLTFEKSFSRMDDAKDPRLAGFLQGGELALLAADDGAPVELFASASPRRDGPADQMRMTVELLAAGTQLWTEIDLLDVSEIELGALVSALHAFSRSPHIGGQGNKGHGLVDLAYRLLDLDTGATQPFVEIAGGRPLLAPPAEAAKQAYDQYLRVQYETWLRDHGGEIAGLLGVAP